MIRCTCVREGIFTIVLIDPACPAIKVHERTGAWSRSDR